MGRYIDILISDCRTANGCNTRFITTDTGRLGISHIYNKTTFALITAGIGRRPCHGGFSHIEGNAVQCIPVTGSDSCHYICDGTYCHVIRSRYIPGIVTMCIRFLIRICGYDRISDGYTASFNDGSIFIITTDTRRFFIVNLNVEGTRSYITRFVNNIPSHPCNSHRELYTGKRSCMGITILNNITGTIIRHIKRL